MFLIDSHSHIYLPEFDGDRESIFQRAENEGIKLTLMPAIDHSTHAAMINLEESRPEQCKSMMGVHPCSIRENYLDELKVARDYFEKRVFVAVGETGLDFYWDLAFTEQQYVAFREQIRWAIEFDIPVVIHSRNSIDECIGVVEEFQNGKLKAVFHCFSGKLDQARRIIDLGCYLGIGGVLTFKNSGLDKVMEEIPLDHVVLETDAPYLAPVPFRGKRNEPSYLTYIVDKLSQITSCPKEKITEITTLNAKMVFGLKS
jgi:TatD DNase family protein